MEREINQSLHAIREDISHVKTDVDFLKAIILEDAFLTSEEKTHLEKTMKELKSGKMENFISIDKA